MKNNTFLLAMFLSGAILSYPLYGQALEINPLADQTPSSMAIALRLESEGQEVTELQQNLKKLGFFNLNPTGYYGQQTQEAVRGFQTAYGLVADGIVGNQTLAAIRSALASLNGSTNGIPNGLRQGMYYANAREMLFAAQWKKLESNASNPPSTPVITMMVEGYGWTEVSACSGTGVGFCAFEWQDSQGRKLRVVTVGNSERNGAMQSVVSDWFFIENSGFKTPSSLTWLDMARKPRHPQSAFRTALYGRIKVV